MRRSIGPMRLITVPQCLVKAGAIVQENVSSRAAAMRSTSKVMIAVNALLKNSHRSRKVVVGVSKPTSLEECHHRRRQTGRVLKIPHRMELNTGYPWNQADWDHVGC